MTNTSDHMAAADGLASAVHAYLSEYPEAPTHDVVAALAVVIRKLILSVDGDDREAIAGTALDIIGETTSEKGALC